MIRKLLLVTLAVIFLFGCSTIPQSSPTPSTPPIATSLPANTAVEERVNTLLDQMTLEEKIGQMSQVERYCIYEGAIRNYFLGSVFSGGGSAPIPNEPQAWVDMIAEYQDEALSTRLGIPILYGIDAIHGNPTLYGATIFPQEVGLGATRDPDLVYRIGQATALEMAAIGTRWNFAPVVAVPQDIRWGRKIGRAHV